MYTFHSGIFRRTLRQVEGVDFVSRVVRSNEAFVGHGGFRTAGESAADILVLDTIAHQQRSSGVRTALTASERATNIMQVVIMFRLMIVLYCSNHPTITRLN